MLHLEQTYNKQRMAKKMRETFCNATDARIDGYFILRDEGKLPFEAVKIVGLEPNTKRKDNGNEEKSD